MQVLGKDFKEFVNNCPSLHRVTYAEKRLGRKLNEAEEEYTHQLHYRMLSNWAIARWPTYAAYKASGSKFVLCRAVIELTWPEELQSQKEQPHAQSRKGTDQHRVRNNGARPSDPRSNVRHEDCQTIPESISNDNLPTIHESLTKERKPRVAQKKIAKALQQKERALERELLAYFRMTDTIAIKCNPRGNRGICDLFLTYKGQAIFIELKIPTGSAMKHQYKYLGELYDKGFKAFICFSREQVFQRVTECFGRGALAASRVSKARHEVPAGERSSRSAPRSRTGQD